MYVLEIYAEIVYLTSMHKKSILEAPSLAIYIIYAPSMQI